MDPAWQRQDVFRTRAYVYEAFGIHFMVWGAGFIGAVGFPGFRGKDVRLWCVTCHGLELIRSVKKKLQHSAARLLESRKSVAGCAANGPTAKATSN